MITLENSQASKNSQSNSSSPLSLSSQDESKLSFSDLLKGISEKKDTKVIQNGALVLAIDEQSITNKDAKDSKTVSKKDTLLSMLKNETKSSLVKEESIEIDPKLSQTLASTLDVKEIKKLIFDAKKYLKEQILNTDGYKNSQTKELPKTLKGLAQLATKLGIDVSKITIEKIQEKPSFDAKQILQTKDNNKIAQAVQKVDEKIIDENIQKEIKADEKLQVKIPKEIQKQPIFKATKKVQLSTEQLVQAKGVVNEKQTKKAESTHNLQSLLSDKKIEKQQTTLLKTDVSIPASKVVSPQINTESTNTLESLLHGDSTDAPTKHDATIVQKADNFEVKINEAKQMVKYLSQDVKKAIEDYKAPFTRIKVQLNPHNMGKVDLTVVQRGKNLVVNLSSNNAAINTLALNANELRTQLNNSGINNATLNFNNTQGDGANSSGQNQHHHNEQRAHKEYNYFDNEEKNEEVLSSLEIIVPSYA